MTVISVTSQALLGEQDKCLNHDHIFTVEKYYSYSFKPKKSKMGLKCQFRSQSSPILTILVSFLFIIVLYHSGLIYHGLVL